MTTPTGHGAKYPRKREEAVLALLMHPTLPEAAAAAGIAEKTLWRWTQDPDFREAYRAARAEVVRHALGRLQQGMGQAVQTLTEVMGDANAPHGARVSAARSLLDLAIKAVELEDVEARLDKLEALVAGREE